MSDKIHLETDESPPSYDEAVDRNNQTDGAGQTYGQAGQQLGMQQNIYPPQGNPQHAHQQQQYCNQPQPYGYQSQPYGHQAQQYGYQPPPYGGSGVVIMQQPAPTVYSGPPKDHMGLAIATTLLCCLPLGIVAILKVNEARVAAARGDYTTANQDAEKAKKYSIYGIISGSVLVTILTIILITLAAGR